MVANDDEMQLTVLEMLFSKLDFEVETASNGHEAYEAVEATMQDTTHMYDLVVLDINMPVSNGWEALRNIKNLFHQAKLFRPDQKLKCELKNVASMSVIGPIVDENIQSPKQRDSL